MVYTLPFFSLQNAVSFLILTYLVPVLFTFYIQGVLKLKKNNSGAESLRSELLRAVSQPRVVIRQPRVVIRQPRVVIPALNHNSADVIHVVAEI